MHMDLHGKNYLQNTTMTFFLMSSFHNKKQFFRKTKSKKAFRSPTFGFLSTLTRRTKVSTNQSEGETLAVVYGNEF